MFSRKTGKSQHSLRRILMVVMSIAFLVSGCSLPTNDSPPDQKQVDFKPGERAQCLAEVLPTMSGFMSGEATASQVEKVWDCFGVALNLFSNYVRGRDDDHYTARELATFFERYFFKNVKISDRLLVEVMNLKQIFVGGENKTLTRDELLRLMAFAQQMKVISLRLLPYMRVFSFHWKVSHFRTLEADMRYFEDANMAIQEAAKDLSAIISKNDRAYDIDNMVVLFDEISKVYGQKWTWIDDLEKVLPLVRKLKRTLAGGEEKSIAPYEWRRFSLLGARGFVQYLRYYYFIQTNDEMGGGSELIYLARSFDDLFSFLGDMVSEKPEGVFTRGELLEVAEALGQFLPGFRISDPFLFEVMKIKRVVFGGSLDNFTPQDFQRARAKVDAFRSITEKFLVYANLYGLNWQPELSSYEEAVHYLQEGQTNLLAVGKGLAGIIEDSYDLADLVKFADELEKLYPPESSGVSVAKVVRQYSPLLVSTKKIIFSDNQSVIGKQQWSRFLVIMAQVYGSAMNYHYFLAPTDVVLDHGLGLISFKRFLQEVLSFVEQTCAAKVGQTISFVELEKLVVAAREANLLPKTISLNTTNALLRVVLLKILVQPEKRLQGKLPQGLSKEATTILREEFALWFNNQKLFDDFFGSARTGQVIEGSKLLVAMRAQVSRVELKELINIYESPQSRAFDSLGRLSIWTEPSPYSQSATDTVNLARAIARLIGRAYAMDMDRINRYLGLSLPEANQLFADAKPLAVELGLLDERNTSFADSRFREANLFTPRANGDRFADFVELSDLVLDIFSGLKIDSFVVEKIKSSRSQGCPVIPAGGGSKDKFSISCLTNIYYQNLDSFFSSMPGLRNYLQRLPRCELLTRYPWLADQSFVAKAAPADLTLMSGIDIPAEYIANCRGSFDMMILNILKAAGYSTEMQGQVSFDLSSLVPHVLQYIETVIQRFDRVHSSADTATSLSKDGVLDGAEALAAYPVLRDILSEVSGYQDEKTLRGLLAWIMEKGKPPESNWDKVTFYLIYRNQPDSWNISTDRAKLASILGFISEAIEKKAKNILRVDPTKEIPSPAAVIREKEKEKKSAR